MAGFIQNPSLCLHFAPHLGCNARALRASTMSLLPFFMSAPRLVQWDQLRNTYKNRIASEYARMRNGQSNALLVVDDALALIDSALKTLPLGIQNVV